MIKIYHISQSKKVYSTIFGWYGLSREWDEAKRAASAAVESK